MILKKGTQVKIISGKDKGKTGEILEINRKLNKIKRLNPLDNNHLIACGLHDGLMIFKIMLKKIKLNKNINEGLSFSLIF